MTESDQQERANEQIDQTHRAVPAHLVLQKPTLARVPTALQARLDTINNLIQELQRDNKDREWIARQCEKYVKRMGASMRLLFYRAVAGQASPDMGVTRSLSTQEGQALIEAGALEEYETFMDKRTSRPPLDGPDGQSEDQDRSHSRSV